MLFPPPTPLDWRPTSGVPPVRADPGSGRAFLGLGLGQQGDLASPLDGNGERALLLRGQTCHAPGHDAAAIRDEVAEQARILVVEHELVGLDAEAAGHLAAAPHRRKWAARARIVTLIHVVHASNPAPASRNELVRRGEPLALPLGQAKPAFHPTREHRAEKAPPRLCRPAGGGLPAGWSSPAQLERRLCSLPVRTQRGRARRTAIAHGSAWVLALRAFYRGRVRSRLPGGTLEERDHTHV